MVHDPVEQGHDAANTIHFSVLTVSTQSRRKWYRNVNFIREFKISQRGRGRECLETIHFNYIV